MAPMIGERSAGRERFPQCARRISARGRRRPRNCSASRRSRSWPAGRDVGPCGGPGPGAAGERPRGRAESPGARGRSAATRHVRQDRDPQAVRHVGLHDLEVPRLHDHRQGDPASRRPRSIRARVSEGLARKTAGSPASASSGTVVRRARGCVRGQGEPEGLLEEVARPAARDPATAGASRSPDRPRAAAPARGCAASRDCGWRPPPRGAALRKARRTGGRSRSATVSPQARTTVPRSGASISRMRRRRRPSLASTTSAVSSRTSPAGVRRTPRTSRSIRRAPDSFSSPLMWRLTAGCVMWMPLRRRGEGALPNDLAERQQLAELHGRTPAPGRRMSLAYGCGSGFSSPDWTPPRSGSALPRSPPPCPTGRPR